MIKLKKFAKTLNSVYFVLGLVLALVSIICSVIISYNTNQIEAYALSVEHNHEHVHAEEVKVAAYSTVPNLGNTQMVTAGDTYTKDTLPATGCPKCGCPVKGCSKCFIQSKDDKGNLKDEYVNSCTYTDAKPCPMNITKQPWYDQMMSITGIIDQILTPVLIILGTAGSIFVIVLGINFSKAESADKREEAKKRMINAIIGIVVTLLFLILVKLFTANASEIVKFINGVS